MPLARRFIDKLDKLKPSSKRRKVLKTIDRIVYDGTPTKGTQLVRYSLVKKYFREHLPGFVQHVKVPSQLLDDVEIQRARSLEERQNLQIEQRWIDEILSWKSSGDPIEVTAFLQLTSGRRISEIHSSAFAVIGRKLGSHELRKKRGDSSLCVFPTHPSVSAMQWLKILGKMRRDIGDMSLNTFTRAVSRRLKVLDDQLSTHKMRGIYANLMWVNDGRRQVKTGFIKSVLCLESHDIAINYSAYLLPVTESKS